MVIGITGGIASGKSNVCQIITDLGYPVINCDKITSDLSEIDGPIYKAILIEFGEDYFTFDLQLDKKKLAKLIFHDEEAKSRLNKVTHPIIIDEVKNRLSLIDDGLVFVEAPLLYEAKMEEPFNKIVCVF